MKLGTLLLAPLLLVTGCTKDMDNLVRSSIEIENGQLIYEWAGQGHPLVLIHGGLMDMRMWDTDIHRFAEKYRVIRYNIRGYGNSPIPDSPYSHIDDLTILLDSLDIPSAVIVGLSLGGMIAIDFTLEHPQRVDALVSVASGLNGFDYRDRENLAPQFQAILQAKRDGKRDDAVQRILALPYFVPVKENPRIRDEMRRMIAENLDVWTANQELQIWPSPPSVERLNSITCPTLIITGDHDVSDIQRVADMLNQKISQSAKKVIHGAGHHVNMENPEAFYQTLTSFMDSHFAID